MMKKKRCVGLLWLACSAAYSQTAGSAPAFDAASVKAASPPVPDAQGRIMISGPSGGPGSKDPGRIRYPYMTMKSLLTIAYDVKAFQVTGPAWLDSERFDIDATMPPGISKEQFRTMLQNLLKDRFQLVLHRETKELPMYSMVVAKGGLKIKESTPVAPPPDDGALAAPPALPAQPKIGADGFPVLPVPAGGRGGLFMMMMPGRARFTAQQQTMEDLAARLTNQLSRPVTDATGLKGKYDFTLTFSNDGLPGAGGPNGPLPVAPPGGAAATVSVTQSRESTFTPDGEAPPDLFTAIQAQLGLKLESKKGNVEIIVIDRGEKTPIAN